MRSASISVQGPCLLQEKSNGIAVIMRHFALLFSIAVKWTDYPRVAADTKHPFELSWLVIR